jgi:hypothetical protein
MCTARRSAVSAWQQPLEVQSSACSFQGAVRAPLLPLPAALVVVDMCRAVCQLSLTDLLLLHMLRQLLLQVAKAKPNSTSYTQLRVSRMSELYVVHSVGTWLYAHQAALQWH